MCRLRKSLYGLKQAPRAWHLKLKGELESLGFTPSTADPSLYLKRSSETAVYLLVYVDDLLIASASRELVDEVKKAPMTKFDNRDLGPASVF